MQKAFFIAILFLGVLQSGNAYSQKPHFFAPFQGKKTYCLGIMDKSEKAFVTIKGNRVTILLDEKKVTGTYKAKNILITNDPGEIEYRQNAITKRRYGKYYLIDKEELCILLGEGGGYDCYQICN